MREEVLADVGGDVTRLRQADAEMWFRGANGLHWLGRKDEALVWDAEYTRWMQAGTGATYMLGAMCIRHAGVLLDNGDAAQAAAMLRAFVESDRATQCLYATMRFFTRPHLTITISHWAAAALAERLAEAPTLGAADRAYCEAAARAYAEELAENAAIEEGLRAAVLEAVRAEVQEARHAGPAGGGTRRKKGKKKGTGKGKGKGKKGGKRSKGKGAKEEDWASRPSGAVEQDSPGKQGDDEDEPAAAVEKCAICWSELPPRDPYGNDSSEDEEEEEEDDGEAVATLTCSHAFHAGCLGMWKARCAEKSLVATCPMYRGSIDRMNGRRIMGVASGLGVCRMVG